jgi:hypothetical protein
MDEDPLDLRKGEEEKRTFRLPLSASIFIAITLAAAGIIVAAVLPEVLNDPQESGIDPYSTPLSVVLSSTVESIEIDDKQYRDLSVPTAYYILLSEANSNMSGADSLLSGYLDFILGDDTPYELTVSSGQGWTSERSHTISNAGPEEIQPRSASQDVVVDMVDGQEVTINFELKIWEINHEG